MTQAAFVSHHGVRRAYLREPTVVHPMGLFPPGPQKVHTHFETGQVVQESHLLDGRMHGLVRVWDEQRRLVNVVFYEHGSEVFVPRFFRNKTLDEGFSRSYDRLIRQAKLNRRILITAILFGVSSVSFLSWWQSLPTTVFVVIGLISLFLRQETARDSMGEMASLHFQLWHFPIIWPSQAFMLLQRLAVLHLELGEFEAAVATAMRAVWVKTTWPAQDYEESQDLNIIDEVHARFGAQIAEIRPPDAEPQTPLLGKRGVPSATSYFSILVGDNSHESPEPAPPSALDALDTNVATEAERGVDSTNLSTPKVRGMLARAASKIIATFVLSVALWLTVVLIVGLTGIATVHLLLEAVRLAGAWGVITGLGFTMGVIGVLRWLVIPLLHWLRLLADFGLRAIQWPFNRSDLLLENHPIAWYSTRWLPWEKYLGDTLCGLIRAAPGMLVASLALRHPESPEFWLVVGGALIMVGICSWAALIFGALVLTVGAIFLDPGLLSPLLTSIVGGDLAHTQFFLALGYTIIVSLNTYGVFRTEDERLQAIRGMGDPDSAFYGDGPPDWADEHAAYRLPKLPLLAQRPLLVILCAGLVIAFARLAQASWGIGFHGFEGGHPPVPDFAAWLVYSAMNVFNAVDIFDTVQVFRIEQTLFEATARQPVIIVRELFSNRLPLDLLLWLDGHGLKDSPIMRWHIPLIRSEGLGIQAVVWTLRAGVDIMLIRKLILAVTNHFVYSGVERAMYRLTQKAERNTVEIDRYFSEKEDVDEVQEMADFRRRICGRLGSTLEELGASYINSFIKTFLLQDRWHPNASYRSGSTLIVPNRLMQFASEVVAASGGDVVQCRMLLHAFMPRDNGRDRHPVLAGGGIARSRLRVLELVGRLKENGIYIGRPLRWRKSLKPAARCESIPPAAARLFGLQFNWIGVPEGIVACGSNNPDDHNPLRLVHNTNTYALLKGPVSEEQWLRVAGFNPSYNHSWSHDATYAANLISWHDAVGWCEWINWRMADRLDGWCLRLPTEREWEFACLGGHAAGPTWGGYMVREGERWSEPTIENIAWFDDNSDGETQPAEHVTGCNMKPNAYGFENMLGNVAEWCWDWYGDISMAHEEIIADGKPRGPRDGASRVTRGGSHWSRADECRAARRDSCGPAHRMASIYGFRPALVPAARQVVTDLPDEA